MGSDQPYFLLADGDITAPEIGVTLFDCFYLGAGQYYTSLVFLEDLVIMPGAFVCGQSGHVSKYSRKWCE